MSRAKIVKDVEKFVLQWLTSNPETEQKNRINDKAEDLLQNLKGDHLYDEEFVIDLLFENSDFPPWLDPSASTIEPKLREELKPRAKDLQQIIDKYR